MYLLTRQKTCPPCGPFAIVENEPLCVRCGKDKFKRQNKYHAERTKLDGYTYDSRFEGGYAAQLALREKAKDILKWERQVPISIYIGQEFIMKSKVDFLVHHKDGSKELVETKGNETRDYRIFRRLLEVVFLPAHPEYSYTVVKQDTGSWRSYKPKNAG